MSSHKLNKNKIKNCDLEYINKELLKNNKKLEIIDLTNKEISIKELEELLTSILYNKYVKILKLNGNKNLNDKLIKNLKNLIERNNYLERF
jgi:hypothetical protein